MILTCTLDYLIKKKPVDLYLNSRECVSLKFSTPQLCFTEQSMFRTLFTPGAKTIVLLF